MQDFHIVALNELNEPFNSTNIYDTPKYVNTNEYVNFFYSSTSGLTLKGDEKWSLDFDYNQIEELRDNVKQDIIGFNQPLPILFNRSGNRYINYKVYDRIPKIGIKISPITELTVINNPYESIYNPYTTNLLLSNSTSNTLSVINTDNDSIIKNINLSDYSLFMRLCSQHNTIYCALSNNTIDVIDNITETISLNIDLVVTGIISDMIYVESVDKFYLLINENLNSNLIILDANTNTIEATIPILDESYSLKYFNNFIYFVNNIDSCITKFDITTENISFIPTSALPQNIVIDEDRNMLYIRCSESVDRYNITTLSISSITTDISSSNNIIFNKTLDELYITSGSIDSFLQTIDITTFTIIDKTISLIQSYGFYFDELLNVIFINNINSVVSVIDSYKFSKIIEIPTTDNINTWYKIPSGKIYGLESDIDKLLSFTANSYNTNEFIDGNLLFQDTINFNVFEFPTEIVGIEYVEDNQNLTYYTNSIDSAQNYEWFINGTLQLSTINQLNFNFTNYIKAVVSVNVINGRIKKNLTFTTNISVGSSVIGERYEGNILNKLKFFNSNGDNLNFTMVDDGNGNSYWDGDMMFEPNGNDTFKNIDLFILENVDPINYSSSNINTRKMQLFNQYGLDIEGGSNNGTNFLIDKIEVVNNISGFYTKWIYSKNVDKNIGLGSEIFIKNVYNGVIDNSIPNSPILTSYNIVDELNSYNSTSGGVDLFTVVGNKKDAIMVISKTLNKDFSNNYIYGDFRLSTSNIKNIPQGEIVVYNLIKVYDSANLDNEWNEPFYETLLYDQKKISLVNTQYNDGIHTVNYIDNNSGNKINNKYLKSTNVSINNLLPIVSNDFRIKLDFKTNKINLGNNPIDYLPASTNGFLNQRSLLIWDKILNKDYTPNLLKKDLRFSFENLISEPNLANIYTVIGIDTAKNILEYQTSDTQGYRLVLNDYNSIKNFKFEFTINGLSKYTITEGVDFLRGNDINDSAQNLAYILDSISDKVVGLSVISVDNEVWIWEKRNYKFVMDTIDPITFTLNNGVLNTNNPTHGVVGDEWISFVDDAYNGYVHYREMMGNYYIFYFSNSMINWYMLPTNKKVVWTEQTLNNISVNIDYKLFLTSYAYLEDTTVYFTQKGTSDEIITPNMVIQKFITDNKSTFLGYGLDINSTNDNLVSIINNYSTKTLNVVDDYVDITYQFGTNGTFYDLTSSISSQTIDIFNILEPIVSEKNRFNGSFVNSSSISSNYQRKIVIKNIDNSVGLTININGIDYNTPFDYTPMVGMTPSEISILSVEKTLESFGNQKFSISEISGNLVDDEDVGKTYYEVLESQGVLIWLEKSEESYVKGVKHYDTLILESRFPNVNITYSINGTFDEHSITHSDINFIEIGKEISITINGIVYTTLNSGNLSSTISNWIFDWSETLILLGITSVQIGNTIRIGTLSERTQLSFTVWVGKSPILGKPSFNIINYRNNESGIILSGNELYSSNQNFDDLGFSTAMIVSLKNFKFPLNNQEYNIIYSQPNTLGLSYQGAFWNNSDTTTHYINRSGGFNWDNYKTIKLSSNITNGYFSTSGITNIIDMIDATYMEIDSFNNQIWVSHNNSFNGTIKVYDIVDYTIKATITVNNNPTYMKWNPLNDLMYISNKGSNKISVIDTNTFAIVDIIPCGISPTQIVIDTFTNYLYCINEDSNDVTIVDLTNNNSISTVNVGSKPISLTLDNMNGLLYVVCTDNNRVYVIDTVSNSLKTYIGVGNNSNLIVDFDNKVYVSQDNGISVITYNETSNSFSTSNIVLSNEPLSFEYISDLNQIYVSIGVDIIIIDTLTDVIINSVNFSSTVTNLKYVPFANSLFYTLQSINSIGLFDITDEFYNKTTIDINNTPSIINYTNNNLVFVATNNSDIISVLREVPKPENNSSSGSSGNLDLSLSTRDFLRYPRERFVGEETIYFKVSWDNDDDTSMFFYDFSGNQLYIEKKDKNGNYVKINDYKTFNYVGKTPLLDEKGNGYLRDKYNTDILKIDNPTSQQTIFETLYYDLDYIDSETDLDPRPFPLQIFVGYKSLKEGRNERKLKIERIENISLNIQTRLEMPTNPNSGYIDIINFDSSKNSMTTQNSKINFIESGFKVGQIVEISGFETNNTTNEAVFSNSGFIGKITKVNINTIEFAPMNKKIYTESTFTKTYSIFPPFREKVSTISIRLVVQPTTLALINLKAQTEIEDERFKVFLDNYGYNINHKDIYIFKEYDINEAGVDWIFLNQKRKEMFVNYAQIYNYLGSYKALINSVKYFGYNDLEVYEYYLNVDKNSNKYNKLHKIEIPDMFNDTDIYTPSDFILQTLPNKKYEKTKLFNLTYRITDIDGNYVLGYSLDEIITKLVGLKKWLRKNIMPVGTRILDLTGRGDTKASTTIWHDIKHTKKFLINKELTPVDYRVEAYLQPVENYSKTYNVHIEFFTINDFINEYFTVRIKTYSLENKLIVVQNLNYYKSDMSSINFACDLNTDPYITIEVITDNGGTNYMIKRNYLLSNTKLSLLK